MDATNQEQLEKGKPLKMDDTMTPQSPKPEVAQTPGEQPKPEVAQTPGEQPEPEVAQTPGEQPKPEVAQTPGEQSKPEVVQTPGEQPKPEVVQTPGEQPKPEVVQTPGEQPKPGELKKTINIGNQAENIFNNIIFHTGTSNDIPLQDRTDDIPDDLGTGPQPPAADVDAHVARMLSERVVVITAAEDSNLLGAARALFGHPSLADRQPRFVRRISNAPLDQQFMLDDLVKLPVANGKPAVVLVMAADNEPVGLIPRTVIAVADLRNRLKAKDIIVILACTDLTGLPKPLLIPRWNLTPQAGVRTSTTEMPTALVETAVGDDGSGDSLLRLTALYVATRFDRLPIGDFEKVMLLLLDGKTIEREQPAQDKPNFGTRATSRSRTLLAIEVWREQGDTILTRLGVTVRTDHDGRKSMGFTHASARLEAEHYLERSQALFCNRQFDTLMAADVILGSGTSDAVADRALSLLADMLRSDPERGSDAVNELIDEIVRALPGVPGYATKGTGGAGHHSVRDVGSNLSEALKRLFGRRTKTDRQNRLLERTAKLFVALEADPALQAMAWKFLDGVSAQVHRDFFCEFLLVIAEDRRYQPSDLFWRRLRGWIDRAEPELEQDRYYQFITRYLARSEGALFEVLGHLVHWLPKKGEEASTQSSKAALSIVRDYLLYNLQGVVGDPGRGASRPPLLAAIADDTEDSGRFRTDLVRWFFHSAWGNSDLPLFIFDSMPDPEVMRELNRNAMALMFLSCVVQLLIASGNPAPASASARLAHALLKTAYDELGRENHLWLRSMMADYRNTILALRIQANPKQRAVIDTTRQALAEVVQIWNSFRQVVASSEEEDSAPLWFS
ncbi:hypothetical protein [Azospirillum rugosum]|uniref:Uncharacterized protein n=1 Tax=Azospirillum rugosum TaxID=416170 RepID=A0ABS4SRR6_9PROT|nr:hypothetical protein [Azospirillum rugosum]MBP2295250.1 hypothetical protein [Azospirillum rugosum]